MTSEISMILMAAPSRSRQKTTINMPANKAIRMTLLLPSRTKKARIKASGGAALVMTFRFSEACRTAEINPSR